MAGQIYKVGLNNFFGNLQYYYRYTYCFKELLASLNYTKQNEILEFYLIFTQEKYCTKESKMHKSTKRT